MANPWKITSPLKEEPALSEIMSEQLSQRLQIEDDFVWVDVPEAQRVKDVGTASKFDVSLGLKNSSIESSIAQNDKKVVQLVQPEIIGDQKITEQIYYDEDTDIYETDEEEKLDKIDDWECKINYQRPVNMFKVTYPMPQWLKQKEHSTSACSSVNKNQNVQKDNPLLPKIKFGASTTALLERLISDRYLSQYGEVIGRGKNSVLFHAYCQKNNRVTMRRENAVKIYKLGNNKEMNKLLFKRVQREFEHLSMVWEYYCKHPDLVPLMPVRAWENIIIMSFTDEKQSPTIQDLPLQEDIDTNMYLTIVRIMGTCYNVLHIVHGKLCAQNIRYSYKHPLFIGWGHSVKTDHPRALAKLIRDCQFVTEFYSERGVKVKSTEDLFKEITGCTQISSKLLEVINRRDLYDIYDRNPNRMSANPVQPNKNLRFKCN